MLVYIVAVFLLGPVKLCAARLEADIRPGNSFAFVGDTLSVWCNSSANETRSLQLTLFHNGIARYNVTLTTSLANNSHIQATLKITPETIGNNTIVCFSGGHEKLAETSLFVEDRIHNVSNISSVWYYYKHYLEVSWQLGRNYSDDFVHIDVRWSPDVRPNLGGRNCTTLDWHTCGVSRFNIQNILFFRVTLQVDSEWASRYHDKSIDQEKARALFTRRFYFIIEPKTSVKVNSPHEVKLESISSQCVLFSWSNPNFFHDYLLESLVYSAVVRNLENINSSSDLINTSKLDKARFGAWIKQCDLDPFTRYQLLLRLKPLSSVHWGETRTLDFMTPEDRPARGPNVTSTSFWSGPCVNGKREIFVYWKDLTKDIAKGALGSFVVEFNTNPTLVRSKSNHVEAELLCKVTYVVKIFSTTKVGRTLNPSSLIIPSKKSELVFPNDLNFMVLKTNHSTMAGFVDVDFTWTLKRGESGNNLTVVIYFCQGQTFSTNLCIDDFQSVQVPMDQGYFVLKSIPITADRFGYALSDDINQVSGINWMSCVFDANEKPPRPTGVIAYGGEQKNSIFVAWSPHHCTEENNAPISRYHVYCCKGKSFNKSSSCHVKTVEGSASSTLIVGLDSKEASYAVTIVSESPAGVGPASLTVFASPGPLQGKGDSGDAWNGIYIIIGIVVLMAVSAVIGWFAMKCRTRKRLLQEKILWDDTVFDKCSDDSSGIDVETSEA